MLEAREATRPTFLDGAVSDQELLAECSALASGHYAGWRMERMQDQAAPDEPPVLREIWLADREHGGTEIVRLQRLDQQDTVVWRPVSSLLWLPGVF
ncbi:MAG TPA: hypothetical protein VFE42_14330 [Chloroflexota bacterium]|nr:hypothetical protein [Chloroflexota bacterium]